MIKVSGIPEGVNEIMFLAPKNAIPWAEFYVHYIDREAILCNGGSCPCRKGLIEKPTKRIVFLGLFQKEIYFFVANQQFYDSFVGYGGFAYNLKRSGIDVFDGSRSVIVSKQSSEDGVIFSFELAKKHSFSARKIIEAESAPPFSSIFKRLTNQEIIAMSTAA